MSDEGEVILFRQGDNAKTSFDMGVSLGNLGDDLVRGRVDAADAVVVILLRENEPPSVMIRGRLNPDEHDILRGHPLQATAYEASRVLGDISSAWRQFRLRIGKPRPEEDDKWRTFDSWNDYLADRWRKREDDRRERRDAKAAAMKAKPWLCEHCGKRYTSEGWAVRHEARCPRRPCRCNHPRLAHRFPSGDCATWTTDNGSCACPAFAPSSPERNSP